MSIFKYTLALDSFSLGFFVYYYYHHHYHYYCCRCLLLLLLFFFVRKVDMAWVFGIRTYAVSPVGYTVQLATNLLFIIQYVVELSFVIFFYRIMICSLSEYCTKLSKRASTLEMVALTTRRRFWFVLFMLISRQSFSS